MNTLLVIDDRRIREQAFGAAEKLIRKLERLEADLATYQEEDQRLYSDWYDLTFREHRQRIEDLQSEFDRLAKFHNLIVAVSEMLDLTMPDAYRYLRNEEENYLHGSAQDRVRIDAERRAREVFMSERIKKESGHREKAEDTHFREAEDTAELTRIAKMSDGEIQDVCRDYDQAYMILTQILLTVRSPNDGRLLLRVWDLLPSGFQKTMARDFEEDEGGHLFTMLETLRDDLDDIDEARQTRDRKQTKSATTAPANETPDGESRIERLKLLYRKLVRKLHPDVNTHLLEKPDRALAKWHEKVWHRVQAAYQSEDFGLLRKIERLVLIRNRHLTEITVSEIFESQGWLQEEIDRLNTEAKALKRQPAWKFSRKKDHADVQRKIEKSLEAEFQNINDEIEVLADEHRMFEVMSRPSSIRRSSRGANRARGERSF